MLNKQNECAFCPEIVSCVGKREAQDRKTLKSVVSTHLETCCLLCRVPHCQTNLHKDVQKGTFWAWLRTLCWQKRSNQPKQNISALVVSHVWNSQIGEMRKHEPAPGRERHIRKVTLPAFFVHVEELLALISGTWTSCWPFRCLSHQNCNNRKSRKLWRVWNVAPLVAGKAGSSTWKLQQSPAAGD